MKTVKKKTALIVKIIIASCILLAALIVSLVSISDRKADNRFVFLFESLDDEELHIEVRYINTVPEEDDVNCFVNEILLGPVTNRYRPLFARGTTVRSCFMRDGILYIDLSEEALLAAGSSSETERACNLLKESISLNFRQVDDIKLFISGIEAYKKEDVLLVTDD